MGNRSLAWTRSRSRVDAGQVLVLTLLVGTPALLLVALRTIPPLDPLFQSVGFHLLVVSAISACALAVAIPAAVAAVRTRRFPLVMLALGCVFVGLFMLGHGLTTPGIWGRPINAWVGRFPTLALAAFAACLGAAVLSPAGAIPRFVERHAAAAILLPAALVAVGCAVAVQWPAAGIGGHLLPGEDVGSEVLAAVTALVLFVTGEVHRRRWQLSRDRVELALLLACWLSTESVASLRLGVLWHLSWWDYHALLLVGFAGAVYAVLAAYRRSRTAEGALSGVTLRSRLDRIEHGHPEAVRSLVSAVEAKDAYTRGHSARVADLSVRIGELMGLRPDMLRSLAQGGLLHDIGKIGVPDQVLNKPGLLTPEERAEIEKHPIVGWEIVRQSPSLRGALSVVRHHHERVDGTGYPDHLVGPQVPLEARIAAVADVWDALTSDRAYRPAWATDRALDVMIAGRGAHFAPDALDALLEVLEADGIRPLGRAAPREDPALEGCHPPQRRAVTRSEAR